MSFLEQYAWNGFLDETQDFSEAPVFLLEFSWILL